MQIHIFRGPGRVFGFTPEADGGNLPTQFAPWTAFKSVEMNRGQTIPGVHIEECLDDIEKFGFHLTDAHVRITGKVTPS
jgi:hypothetical protein